jgi:hypothetical protein
MYRFLLMPYSHSIELVHLDIKVGIWMAVGVA